MSEGQQQRRERTIRWDDPLATFHETQRLGLTGIELLERVRDGVAPPPPMVVLMGFTLKTVEPGRIVFTVEPAEYHYNPLGVVHGGLAATLLDSAMGCAVQTLSPTGAAYTTLELKINLVRALHAGMGVVSGEGTVLHFGRQTALAEARVIGPDGKLYAHATSTCLIVRSQSHAAQ